MNRLFLINKKSGVTSFKEVSRVRRKLNIKKAGHAGTLDQFASGLLLILTGRYTRLVEYFTGFDKVYRAIFEFGKETDTFDPEGAVTAESAVPLLSDIESVLPAFSGKIFQQPPLYSAVHVNGERAYRLAMKGERVEIPAREIEIFDWKVLGYSPPYLESEIRCSKGTYIRSLARDLGRACGSRAYVKTLERTAVGGFSLAQAVTVNDLKEDGSDGLRGEALFSLLPDLPVCRLKSGAAAGFFSGKPFAADGFETPPPSGTFAVFCGGRFAGMMEKEKTGRLRYRFVLTEDEDR